MIEFKNIGLQIILSVKNTSHFRYMNISIHKQKNHLHTFVQHYCINITTTIQMYLKEI